MLIGVVVLALAASNVGDARPRAPALDPSIASPINVEVRQTRELLWRGQLRLATGGSALFNLQQTDSTNCIPEGGRNAGRQTTKSLRINLAQGNRTPERVTVILEATRPYSDDSEIRSCSMIDSNLTNKLQTEVELPRGQPITLDADGGLSITLTRQ